MGFPEKQKRKQLHSWIMFCKNTSHQFKCVNRPRQCTLNFYHEKVSAPLWVPRVPSPWKTFAKWPKPTREPGGKTLFGFLYVATAWHTPVSHCFPECLLSFSKCTFSRSIWTTTERGSIEVVSSLALWSWRRLFDVLIKTCGVHKRCRQNCRQESISNNSWPAPQLIMWHSIWTQGKEKGIGQQKSPFNPNSTLRVGRGPEEPWLNLERLKDHLVGKGMQAPRPLPRGDGSCRQEVGIVLGSFPLAAHKFLPSLVLCHLAP